MLDYIKGNPHACTHTKKSRCKCAAFISLIRTFSHNSHDSGCRDKVFPGCGTNCGHMWWWCTWVSNRDIEFFRIIRHSKIVWKNIMMKILGQRSNELLKICNIIRVHRQGHNSVGGRKTRFKKCCKNNHC